MNIALIAWRAQVRSLYNASRYDTKMRITLIVMAVISVASGFWFTYQLKAQLYLWLAQGPVATATGLWLVCLQTWAGMAFFAIIGVRQALSSDEAILLFTLPVTRAMRFRMLFGSFFLENLWSWFLLQIVVMGYTLSSMLGWQAIRWLVVLQAGILVAVLAVLLITLVLLYAFTDHTYRTISLLSLTILLVILLLSLLLMKGVMNVQEFAYSIHPEWISVAFVGILLGAFGPLAVYCGSLYEATFHAMQGRDYAGSGFILPGLRWLCSMVQRQRTLVGALWYRALLNQSRNWFFWARLVVILVVLMLFPLLHTAISRYHITDVTFVIWYTSAVALLHALETAVNAISGEASRLALYITAPLTLARFLRAKLLLFVLPVCIEGVLIGLYLCWRLSLSGSQRLLVIATVALIIVITLSWLVSGSAWDEDINLVVEGPAQALLQEEMPISPRRIWLLNSCVVLYGLLSIVVWKIPLLLVIPFLALLTVAIVLGMGYWSYRYVLGLLRLQELCQTLPFALTNVLPALPEHP